MWYSHRSFGSSSMSGGGPLGARLSCGCHLCLLWRRIGEEIHLGHFSSGFQQRAQEVLRSGFDQLIDFREENRLEVWGSVAEEPSRPPGNKEEPGKSPERGRDKSEEKKKRRKMKPERRRHSSEESAEVSSPQVKKKEEKKKNKERSRSARHRQSRRSSSTSSKVKRPSVKEEPSEVERDKGPTEEVVGERPPEKPQKTGEEKSPLTPAKHFRGNQIEECSVFGTVKGKRQISRGKGDSTSGNLDIKGKAP